MTALQSLPVALEASGVRWDFGPAFVGMSLPCSG